MLVGAGGFLGAVARYLVSVAVKTWLGEAWPWATFIINVTGCAAIALFIGFAASRTSMSHAWRYLFPIGFVGAYTTFSTYSLETVKLAEAGEWWRAISYVVASTVMGIVAIVFGLWLGRRM